MLHASQLAAQICFLTFRISDNARLSSGRFSELRTQSARPLQQGNDLTLKPDQPDLPTTSALFSYPYFPATRNICGHRASHSSLTVGCVLPSQVHSRPTIRIRRQICRFLQVAL